VTILLLTPTEHSLYLDFTLHLPPASRRILVSNDIARRSQLPTLLKELRGNARLRIFFGKRRQFLLQSAREWNQTRPRPNYKSSWVQDVGDTARNHGYLGLHIPSLPSKELVLVTRKRICSCCQSYLVSNWSRRSFSARSSKVLSDRFTNSFHAKHINGIVTAKT
jgi:hypothetical protein